MDFEQNSYLYLTVMSIIKMCSKSFHQIWIISASYIVAHCQFSPTVYFGN